MRVLVSTLPRRLGWAALVFAFAAAAGLAHLRGLVGAGGEPLNDRLVLRWLLGSPLLCGLATYLVASLWFRPPAGWPQPARPAVGPPLPGPAVDIAPPFKAQVVGLQWLNPLQRRDYPTQWQLLWTLGLARPNDDDEKPADDPDTYAKVGVVAPIVGVGEVSHPACFARYLDKLLDQMHDAYFDDPLAFYGVALGRATPRSLAGIHVVCVLPRAMEPSASALLVRERMAWAFGLGQPGSSNAHSQGGLPTVHVVSGDADAGREGLTAALDYLAANPGRTVWLLGWDAPDLDGAPRLNESLVLLVLAGPEVETDRAALAWVGHAASVNLDALAADKTLPRVVRGWQAVLDAVAANAGPPESAFGYIVHDAGHSSNHLGHLAQTLSMADPEFDLLRQSFDSRALFGEAGACAVLTDLALAVGCADHLQAPVFVARTSSVDQLSAAAVMPAGRAGRSREDMPWFRARSEAHAHLPWWGRRRDVIAGTGLKGSPT